MVLLNNVSGLSIVASPELMSGIPNQNFQTSSNALTTTNIRHMNTPITPIQIRKTNVAAFLAALAVGALLETGASAQIISVDFDNTTSLASPTMETTDLAGAPGVRVGNWNAWIKNDLTLGDAGQVIVDNNGSTVAGFTATLTYSPVSWASRNNNTVNDQAMYSDVIDAYGGDDSLSVSGIPYALYDVYVYMYDDGSGRAGSFTIGSTTYYARGFGPAEGTGNPASDGTGYVLSTDITLGSGSDIDQGNYVVFSGLSGDSFTLFLSAVNAGNLDRNKVPGFQIVAAVPEPSSFALVGLGLFGLIASRRRRS
jgi:hypothetical protein